MAVAPPGHVAFKGSVLYIDCLLYTSGAGDTFAACFLYALDRGLSLADCGRFANAGASFCIETVGAAGAGNDPDAILKRAGLAGRYPPAGLQHKPVV